MLQLFEILKEYRTGDLVQRALNRVSLNFRDNEFVAILGPSGSGKTTLLNIIGGLDQYDEGDLIIDGVSTKKYRDRDWDSYRNHSVGFVFQNYNLIPHQSVLENVELALTISGISRKERRERAKEALIQVGLEEHMNKRPNQLSGGQMQRVAIARALVNDPKILLADEPTGALDSETSVQVMELLKEVSYDRLVIMVTHNPELAEDYATRIVELWDGEIVSDSDPLDFAYQEKSGYKENRHGKTSMSFFTALALSFKNLKTKKARTLLTAFAGSIGIIGIALILSLSNGVNNYITNIQRETMVSYPVTIQAQGLDLSSIIESQENRERGELGHERDAVYSNPMGLEVASTIQTGITENNLTDFKKYLDDPKSEINKYIGDNGVFYSYDTRFDLFSRDPDGILVNTNGSTLDKDDESESSRLLPTQRLMAGSTPLFGGKLDLDLKDNNAQELMPGQNDELISPALTENFEVVAGDWPQSKDEIVLFLDQNNEIAASSLYQLGILPSSEYEDISEKIDNGEKVNLDTERFNYDDLIGRVYRVVPQASYYEENSAGNFENIEDNEKKREELIMSSLPIKIAGIVRAVDEDANQLVSESLGYTQALTNYLIKKTDESDVVKAQKADPEKNVLNGFKFAPGDDAAKVEDAKTYLRSLGVSQKAQMMRQLMAMTGGTTSLATMDETALAASLDTFLANPDQEAMLQIYDNYISPGTYDDNLSEFGVVSLDAPSEISIYADTFEDKDKIGDEIAKYNEDLPEADQISYTDFVGLLMSSVTTIINVITWVLVAFVAVALVVSSIMIGIITYISVLERTREIGILRSIGASKRNISQVFNAETIIIGLISGLLGIGLTLLLLIPTNMIIHTLIETGDVNAQLPWLSAIVLILLSIVLTYIGGLIPAKKAAKKDPVTALRTE